MKLGKKLLAVLLAAAFAVMLPQAASASFTFTLPTMDSESADTGSSQQAKPKKMLPVTQKAPTEHALKDKINAMKLEPHVDESWGKDFYKHINSITSDDMTNFEKMWTVYEDVVLNNSKNQNCVGYAVNLQCAFEAVGFRTYHMRGEVTQVGGGWTVHSWVGVLVDGKLVYFDANIPGLYNGNSYTYFAVPHKNASFYRNAHIQELTINPNGGALLMNRSYDIPSSMIK